MCIIPVFRNTPYLYYQNICFYSLSVVFYSIKSQNAEQRIKRAEFRGCSVQFVLTKLDQQDPKAAEFVEVSHDYN